MHSFQKSGNWPAGHLLYSVAGGTASVLASNRVNTFSCVYFSSNSLVTVGLQLKDVFDTINQPETIDMPLSIFLRN